MTTPPSIPVHICTNDAPLRALLQDGLKRGGFSPSLLDTPSALDAALPGFWLICDAGLLDNDTARRLRTAGGRLLTLIPAETVDSAAIPQGATTMTLPLRLGALLDRLTRPEHAETAATITIGPYLLDPQDSILTATDQAFPIRLTEKERDILIHLHGANGAIVAREELLEKVWGYAPDIETHTLETHIYRLRRKIEADPAQPLLLITEEKGYRLRPP